MTSHSLSPFENQTECQSFYQDLVETSQDLIWQCDKEGRYVFLNKAWETTFGYTLGEMLGKKFTDFQTPEFAQRDFEQFEKILKGDPIKGYETVHLAKDGHAIHLVFNSKAFYDKNHNFQGVRGTAYDITERKKNEIRISESEELYRTLIETTDTGFAVLDKAGSVLDANSEYIRLTGYKEKENIIGKTITEWTDSNYIDKSIEALQKCVKNGNIKNFEVVYCGPDQKRIPVEMNASVIQSKKDVQIISLCRDISHRKKIEESLRISEEKFRNIVYASPMGMHLYELRGEELIFTGANPAATDILGIDHEVLFGKKVEDAFPGLIGTKIPDYYRTTAREGTLWRSEQIDYNANEIQGAFEVVAFQTEPNKMVALFNDITERKRNEAELEGEKERLAVTLRSIGDGVIATDTNGNVVLMNSVAEELTGWVQQEALGKPLSVIFNIINELTRNPCENPVDKVLQTGDIIELANHTVLISKDGKERVIADSGAPIRNRKHQTIGVVLVFRDMTEKQKLIESAQTSQKLESLGILAGGIAHDFNNLLSGIFGYIDLAKSEIIENTTISEYLNSALNSMNRARALTQQLLTFAKGGTPIKKTDSLVPFIQENARFALSGSNISCDYRFQENLWNSSFDKNQIGQVIDNIIINAIQAMPIGGKITISAENLILKRKEHAFLPEGKYVKVSICDSGIGIPKEILNRIFDPFFTTKQKGSGLGLAISYSIISRHGGSIDVESIVGKGSTFHIILPASTEKIDTQIQQKAEIPYGEGDVLLMDDEIIIRETVGAMLRKLGYTVTAVSSGEEVLSTLIDKSNKKFKAIILDLTVPGRMGGIETASEIRKMDKTIPLIVSSGYADDPVIAFPKEYGFIDSMCKPFKIVELAEILHKYIAGKERV